MTLDVVLRQYILEDTELGAVLGGRVYPVRLPQKVALPALTMQQISEERIGHLRGVAGLARTRYQVDTYDLWPKDAKILGGLVRQRLDGFQGMWTEGGSPSFAVYVQAVIFASALDLFDEDILGGSSRHSADYFIIHRPEVGVS